MLWVKHCRDEKTSDCAVNQLLPGGRRVEIVWREQNTVNFGPDYFIFGSAKTHRVVCKYWLSAVWFITPASRNAPNHWPLDPEPYWLRNSLRWPLGRKTRTPRARGRFVISHSSDTLAISQHAAARKHRATEAWGLSAAQYGRAIRRRVRFIRNEEEDVK